MPALEPHTSNEYLLTDWRYNSGKEGLNDTQEMENLVGKVAINIVFIGKGQESNAINCSQGYAVEMIALGSA